MEIIELPTARLRRRIDCRTLNEGRLKEMMRVMKRDGFWKWEPLLVRPIKIRELNNGNVDGWEITDGRHRFEAAWRLNFETAPCCVVTEDDLHAEMHMIEANIIRADLGPIDIAKQTARLKVLYEEAYPETKYHVSGGIARHAIDNVDNPAALENSAAGFVADTSPKIGRAQSTIRRDVQRGVNISDEAAEMIRGTPLDNGKFLDELQVVPMECQVSFIELEQSKRKAEKAEKPTPRVRSGHGRGRPCTEGGPTTLARAAAEYTFALCPSKMRGLIDILKGVKHKYYIRELQRMLNE